MIGQVREWLPLGVTTREAVRAKIDNAVADWSAHWFAKRSVSVSSFKPTLGEARGDSDGAGWRIHRQAVAVSCSNRSAARLVDWALDVRLDELELANVDQLLVERFERKLFEDLVVRVERALGLDGGLPNSPVAIRDPLGRLGGVVIGLAESQGAELLWLAIPLPAILPLCKSTLGPRTRTSVRLEPLARALAPIELSIEATLGETDLLLSDLQSLAPGDVLVLDTPLTGAAAVSLTTSDHAFARAKLSEVDGQAALSFQA